MQVQDIFPIILFSQFTVTFTNAEIIFMNLEYLFSSYMDQSLKLQ